MTSPRRFDWIPWITCAAILTVLVIYYRTRPVTKFYAGFTNIIEVNPPGNPIPPEKKGEIPLVLHSGIRGVRIDTESNHLVVRVPLSPDLEKTGIKVSVDPWSSP